jgi:hypothetical protein
MDSLASIGMGPPTPEATRAFVLGVSHARAGRSAAAADAFNSAVLAQPAWPDARYNLGVVLGDLGRHTDGAGQLQEYLALSPRAQDAAAVARVIGRWEAAGDRGFERGTALTLGLVVPGMGQFYSGRSTNGLVVLAAAGGAIAAGLLVRRVDVRCLDEVAPGDTCSPGRVVSRRESRPYIGVSIATAGAVTVLGALDAYFCWTCGGRSPR